MRARAHAAAARRLIVRADEVGIAGGADDAFVVDDQHLRDVGIGGRAW